MCSTPLASCPPCGKANPAFEKYDLFACCGLAAPHLWKHAPTHMAPSRRAKEPPLKGKDKEPAKLLHITTYLSKTLLEYPTSRHPPSKREGPMPTTQQTPYGSETAQDQLLKCLMVLKSFPSVHATSQQQLSRFLLILARSQVHICGKRQLGLPKTLIQSFQEPTHSPLPLPLPHRLECCITIKPFTFKICLGSIVPSDQS